MDDLQTRLHGVAEPLSKRGARVTERLLTGPGDKVLVNLAQTEAPQLIVVASAGKSGIDRWLLGSVSERTAEQAPCPTLVVRDAAVLTRWTEGRSPLKVFVCFNFTKTSDEAMRWVRSLHAMAPCDIVVGHVDWPVEQYERLGGSGPLPMDANPPEVQRILEREVRTRAQELLGGIPFRLRVEADSGRSDVRLAAMAREEGAGLLVTGTHQYRGFERFWHASISRGLLQQAGINVAVVPLATSEARGTNIAPQVRRVLVATDFSETANEAIPHAYALLPDGGTVHLLHVVPQLRMLSGGQQPVAGNDEPVWECAARLRRLIPSDAAERGIATRVEVLESHDVAQAICRNAECIDADLVCLGSHGRSGLLETLLGSVSREVMARSRRKLLIVHPQAE